MAIDEKSGKKVPMTRAEKAKRIAKRKAARSSKNFPGKELASDKVMKKAKSEAKGRTKAAAAKKAKAKKADKAKKANPTTSMKDKAPKKAPGKGATKVKKNMRGGNLGPAHMMKGLERAGSIFKKKV